MNNRTIRWVVVLAVISLIGIAITQFFWFSKAFRLKEKEFDHQVQVALQQVGEKLMHYYNLPPPAIDLVEQLSENYYVVMVNSHIDGQLLEEMLKKEFMRRNLLTDFEYGIYDCQKEQMIYGNYVSLENLPENKQVRELPTWEGQAYYFGVYFPNRTATLVGQMEIWLFSTATFLVVLVFFAYTVWIILQQKRFSEIQKDFINNMTHEFKTPIASIQVAVDLLKKTLANVPEAEKYLSLIHEQTRKLKQQIEYILQVAWLERNPQITLEKVSLTEVVQKSIANFQLLAEKKQATISFFPQESLSLIWADVFHVSNILHNLIDNALKYSKEKPSIEICVFTKGNHVGITIEDNGIGIQKKDQKRIFDKFFRVSTGNLHNVKGFGLGLYYVRQMMKAHGGSISLESEWQKGTRVTLFFKKADETVRQQQLLDFMPDSV